MWIMKKTKSTKYGPDCQAARYAAALLREGIKKMENRKFTRLVRVDIRDVVYLNSIAYYPVKENF